MLSVTVLSHVNWKMRQTWVKT